MGSLHEKMVNVSQWVLSHWALEMDYPRHFGKTCRDEVKRCQCGLNSTRCWNGHWSESQVAALLQLIFWKLRWWISAWWPWCRSTWGCWQNLTWWQSRSVGWGRPVLISLPSGWFCASKRIRWNVNSPLRMARHMPAICPASEQVLAYASILMTSSEPFHRQVWNSMNQYELYSTNYIIALQILYSCTRNYVAFKCFYMLLLLLPLKASWEENM